MQNSYFKGIFFMLLASLFFAINDTFTKYAVKNIGNDLSLFNVVFLRGLFASLLILISIFFFGNFNLKKLLNEKRAYLRGMFEVFAALNLSSNIINYLIYYYLI